MTDKRARVTGRRGRAHCARFVQLPHEYFDTPEFHALSGRALKLLIGLALQYNGANNGDLCATFSVMRRCGFSSADQLRKALCELRSAGWVITTRQGGRNLPSLFALTWLRIDPCGGKLDVSPGLPRHLWRKANAAERELVQTESKCRRRIGKQKGDAVALSLHRHAAQVRPSYGAMLDRDAVQAIKG